MSEADLVSNRLNKKKTRHLFFNAVDTSSAFHEVSELKPPCKTQEEVREDLKPINPYQLIEDRNKELDSLRFELATQSTDGQKLIKNPHAEASNTETLTVEEVPRFIKEATERILMKKALQFQRGGRKKLN